MNKLSLFNDDAYTIVEDLIQRGIKVDHIITDPPYNISQANNFSTMKYPRAGVNFGNWDQGRFELYAWIPLYRKLLNENGSMIIFCSYRYMSYIIDVLESDETGMVVKDVLVWQKANPMPRNINRRYVQDMEFAVWAVPKKAKWVFHKPENKPYLRALFSTLVVHGTEKLGHPTQKNIHLMESIISIHTNVGDIVLDPFMGSGSTGAAAFNLEREFIGIEIDQEYFEMAKQRFENLLSNGLGPCYNIKDYDISKVN